MDKEKRELRLLKRDIKRAGNKHRRRQLKRDLVENPEEAAHSSDNVGRNSSTWLNGLYKDAKRRQRDRE